jgi:SAM-dependent methyltransferase
MSRATCRTACRQKRTITSKLGIQNKGVKVPKIKKLYYEILKIDRLRFYYCKMRYRLRKKTVKFLDAMTTGVGSKAVNHNISAFGHDAVFGMAKRMSLLLYPTTALLRGNENPKVLIVGPRTEDDIFWARSLGLYETTGLDLFTYSSYIALGDIHKTQFADGTFDAVLLGWCLAYSVAPQLMIDESKRITKNNGFLGVGLAVYPPNAVERLPDLDRANPTNSLAEICALVAEEMVFASDPKIEDKAYECAAIFKIKKPIAEEFSFSATI